MKLMRLIRLPLFCVSLLMILGGSFLLFPAEASAMKITLLPETSSVSYTSIIQREEPFNTLMLNFDHEMEGLMMNARPSVSDQWEPIEVHDDGFGAQALIFTSPTDEIQFKLADSDGQPVDFDAEFLNFEGSAAFPKEKYSSLELALSSSKIISRSEWGADETLRYWTPELEELYKDKPAEGTDPCEDIKKNYREEVQIVKTVKFDGNGEFIWPFHYMDEIKKIVVHHTDSEVRDLTGDARMDGRDYQAMMQAIYYYHTVRRGWGDIGYHYVIDPLGNIYEGRAGGDKVIAAHALCHNNGSLGIAVIGNYEDNDIPEPAMRSLVQLISQKAKTYHIDPKGTSLFRGKKLPNILAHRDVRATSCPGQKLYAVLPRLRELVNLSIRSGSFNENQLNIETLDYNAELVGSMIDAALLPNQRKSFTLAFKNTGKKSWDQNTWLHVALNNDKGPRVIPVIEDKAFVAADMQESQVAPGEVGHFEVQLQAGFWGSRQQFQLSPIVNGKYKISRAATFARISTDDPVLDYEVVSQTLPKGVFFQGQAIQAAVKLKNTGNVNWVNYGNSPIRLGTEKKRDRKSILVNSTRLAHLLESEVAPGEVGTFVFDLEVPDDYEGGLTEHFAPVIEHVSWLKDKQMKFEIEVREPRHLARIADKTRIESLLPGEQKKITLTFENRGDLPWDEANMRVNLFSSGLTLFKAIMRPKDKVKPNETADFSFWVQAPYEEGKHRVSFSSRFNRTLIRGASSRFLIDVPLPRLRAQRIYQSDKNFTTPPGKELELEVHYKNISNVVWQKRGQNSIYLAPSEPQDRKSRLYHDSWVSRFRAAQMEEDEVYPGETATFKFKVRPDRKGVYRENFQLVIERVGWLDSSLARWDLRVFGDPVKENKVASSSSEMERNQARAATAIKVRENAIREENGEKKDKEEMAASEVAREASASNASSVNEPSLYKHPFRVLISYQDEKSVLTANQDFVVSDGHRVLFEAVSGQEIFVDRVNHLIRAEFNKSTYSAEILRFIPQSDGIIEIISMERRPEWNKSLNDNQFRGIMELRPDGDQIIFINELPLEDYMKGLAEVSNNTPEEKQKAIAVLARTYARFYMQESERKFPGKPYDGSDDPAIFQRYLGYGVEKRSPNFVKAVETTKDQVVTYNGKLVKTPYFNQSNGRTLSAKEVWGWTHTPYLQSVDDPYCKGLTQNGHGVGMSGCGAEGMAKAGKSYEEIIKYYYNGVAIETIDN